MQPVFIRGSVYLCKVLWPGTSAPLDGSQTPRSGSPTPWPTSLLSSVCQHGGQGQRGRCWFWLWAIKVFLCWNWLVVENWRSCGVEQTPLPVVFALAVLHWSSVTQQHHGGGPGALWGQVSQGSEQNRALQLVLGRGNTLKFWELQCCNNVQIFHWFCALFCLWLQLLPPPSFSWHHHLEWCWLPEPCSPSPAGFGLA